MDAEQRLKYFRIFYCFRINFYPWRLSDDELDMAFRLGLGTPAT
jgi:hypothetical protein